MSLDVITGRRPHRPTVTVTTEIDGDRIALDFSHATRGVRLTAEQARQLAAALVRDACALDEGTVRYGLPGADGATDTTLAPRRRGQP